MEKFLSQCRAILGTGKQLNILISFDDDEKITVISTIKRKQGEIETPLKISGAQPEVALNYFSILGSVAPSILKLDDNSKEVIKAAEQETSDKVKREEVKANAKAKPVEKKPVKTKEEIEAEKEKEKQAKVLEKLNANTDWITAKLCFKMKQFGIAKSNAEKVFKKFVENKDVRSMIVECNIALTIVTREDAEKSGHKEWLLPEDIAAPVAMKPNENFDNEGIMHETVEKVEKMTYVPQMPDPTDSDDIVDPSIDTPMAEQMEEEAEEPLTDDNSGF